MKYNANTCSNYNTSNIPPNIPQLKLGDIQEYHLSDIPQFSNLMIILNLTIHLSFRMREGFVVATEEFCTLSHTREHSKENILPCIQ